MLYTIARPAVFIGLLIAFLLALTLRVVATRLLARALGLAPRYGRLLPNPREDIDPFGAVAALIAGTGWGRPIDTDAMPRWAGRGRKAAVVAAGPLTPLLVGLILLTAYRLTYPDAPLIDSATSMMMGGGEGSPLGEFWLALAGGLVCFGVLNVIPWPPLDGFALLWLSLRRVRPSSERARMWLVENNLGVVLLLILAFFPFASPMLHLFINLVALPFLWVWA